MLKVGEDTNDDGLIDPGSAPLRQARLALGRFWVRGDRSPAAEEHRREPGARQGDKAAGGPAPTWPIHPVKDIKTAGGRSPSRSTTSATRRRPDFTVEVLDESGRVIDRKIVPTLAAPLDFVPKTVDVTLAVPGGKWAKIVVDGRNAVREILESNNEAPNASH